MSGVSIRTEPELLLRSKEFIDSDFEMFPGPRGLSVPEDPLDSLKSSTLIPNICLFFLTISISCPVGTKEHTGCSQMTGPNYADWLRNLRIVLWIEKLEYVIDSPKPTEPASDAHNDEHVVYRKWIDNANVAQYIMLASMNIELQKQHEHMDAHTILMHLQELYDVAGRTARYEISKELFGCRMSKGSSVNNHVFKMINLIERLGQLGFAMDGELSQDLVLQSLPSSNPKKRKRNSSKKKKVGEKMPVPPKAEDPKSKVVCFHCNKGARRSRTLEEEEVILLMGNGARVAAEDSPFSGHGERAANLLGMVHTDVCGPMSKQAMGGFSYFITFMDNRSRFRYVFDETQV
ncbi:hypothetical protein AgCh_031152 [Apium graveolens]